MGIGLALAGGGIKGAAHIGAIKAIEEEKIKISYISGASSGSIVASMYAMGYNYKEIFEYFKKYSSKIKYIELKNILKLIYGCLFKNKIIINGLNTGEKIEKFINEVCMKKGIYNINQIKMPLYIPTVDIRSGKVCYFCSKKNKKILDAKEEYLNEGNIGKIVRASCSYPVIFSPCEYNNTQLIDGGIRENLPWKILKNDVKDIIAICFDEKINQDCCFNIINIINHSLYILSDELKDYELKGIENLIKIETEDIGLLDTSKIDFLFELGYKTTKEQIKTIKYKIKNN